MDISDGDPDKEANFSVIRRTFMRAALFELDFIHTEKGERLLGSPQFQSAAARALADGLRSHFGITTAGAPAAAPAPAAPASPLKTRLAEMSAELLTLADSL